MSDQITYTDMFAWLRQLGFQDSSKSEFDRVFSRDDLGIVLVFGMMDDPSLDRVVRAADILSVETRLRRHGLLEGTLEDAIQRLRTIGG